MKSFFKAAAGILIAAVVTIATAGLGTPAALAIGGFVGGFGGTLINGSSMGQAIGMGFVGAFAGGVGGVAWGIGGIGRIAALTAIGATAGAAGSAIMGGNIGLGAAAGAAGGFIGGAVGGRLADAWKPGLARLGAGIATGAGAGAASAAIAGGSPGTGAGMGAFSVAAAIAAGKLQQAFDAGRRSYGQEGDKIVGLESARENGGIVLTGGTDLMDSAVSGYRQFLNKLQQMNFLSDVIPLMPKLSDALPLGSTGYFDIFVNKVTGHITNAVHAGTVNINAYERANPGQAWWGSLGPIEGSGSPERFFENADPTPRLRAA